MYNFTMEKPVKLQKVTKTVNNEAFWLVIIEGYDNNFIVERIGVGRMKKKNSIEIE